MENNISLIQKYYPKEWDNLILPEKIKNNLLALKGTKGYRLMLHSSPGTGKTTTSRIISIGDETMYLSGSNDFKIDVLRNKVMAFAGGGSVLNKQKTIIIDEAENIRNDLQDAFKIILDTAKSVNFIFITNELPKMNDAIVSRCTLLDYDFVGTLLDEHKKLYIKFALDVCKAENIKFDKEGMQNIFKLNFPDFRHLLVNFQQIIDSGDDLTAETVKKFSESGKQIIELYNIIETPSISGKEFYQEISKFKGKEKDCFLSLGEPFFIYLNSKNLFDKTLESAIIVSKYSDMFVNSINKFTTFLSCIVELKSLFK